MSRDERPWVDSYPDGYSVSAKQLIEKQVGQDCAKLYEITDMDIPVECNCGMEVFGITKGQLEGMLNGKVYWAEENGGEYSCLMMRKDGE